MVKFKSLGYFIENIDLIEFKHFFKMFGQFIL